MTDRIMLAVGPKGSRRRALMVLLTAIAVVAAMFPLMPRVLAVHDGGAFELDHDLRGGISNQGNASDDTVVTKLGTLGAQVKVGDTALNVCRTHNANPANGSTLLIEGERFTISSASAGNFGGNCSGTKVAYNVTVGAALKHASSGVNAVVSWIEEGVDKDGPDWDQVHAIRTDTDPTNDDCSDLDLVACSYVHDGIGPSTFIGGASKDHLPIEGWQGTAGASPDKAEILNAYAAKAIDDGDQILYFGMDRYAVDGSTDIGFWFFQNEVTFDPATGAFSGSHADGDILGLATFTQGGATTNIRVFEWQSGAVGAAPGGTLGDCAAVAGDPGCATVNNTTIEAPWNYTFKGAAAGGWIPAGGFFEGGINLSALGLEGCFSSFLAETRSAPELTAILKDFSIGSFEACDSGLTTTPANGATPAAALTDSNDNGIPDISIGAGSVMVKDLADLDIVGVSEWDGTLDFYLCGPLDAPEVCSVANGGVKIGASIPVDETTAEPIPSAAATVTEAGRYCWRGFFDSSTDGVPDATDASLGECFEVLPVEPLISTVATGPVEVGNAIDDTATLGGTATQPGTNGGDATYPSINATNGAAANGTVTFKLYGPAETPSCVDPGNTGANLIGSSVVNVTGNGDYVASDGTLTGTFTPTAAGTYYWVASYSGDSPNTLSVSGSCGDENETSVVDPGQPTIVTQATAGPVPLGSALDDTATLGGTLPQPDGSPANGTITFKLYGPAETPSCVDPGNTGANLIGSSVVNVTGNGDYVASDGTLTGTFTPTAAGTYYWVASYSGDSPNTLSVSGSCGDENEASVVIQLQPDISTAQRFVPNDSATITVADGAGALAGSVVFKLFVNDNDCSEAPAWTSSSIDITSDTGGSALSRTVGSNNTTAYTADGTTFHWVVVYTSTNTGHNDVTSECGTEVSSITVNNNATP